MSVEALLPLFDSLARLVSVFLYLLVIVTGLLTLRDLGRAADIEIRPALGYAVSILKGKLRQGALPVPSRDHLITLGWLAAHLSTLTALLYALLNARYLVIGAVDGGRWPWAWAVCHLVGPASVVLFHLIIKIVLGKRAADTETGDEDPA